MVLGLSSALAKQGIELTILTTNSNGDAGQAPLDVPLAEAIAQDGYQVLYFACSPFRRYKFSLGLLRWLYIHAKDYNIAHVHALFSPVSTAAATIARHCGLPYVLRPLGTLDPADLQKKKQLKQIYGWLWERPNLAGAAALHFTSKQECQVSHRYGVTTQDWIIPLGVNQPQQLPAQGQARQKLNTRPEQLLILYLSRIEPKKGLDLLIPALEAIKSLGYCFKFALAGSNPQDPGYETQIHHRIRRSTIASDTEILGFVQGTEKLSLLQDADLFVLPSYYENFGIAVAEAMAVGTPVLISDRVDLWPAVQQGEAGWISPCELNSLIARFREALESPNERQRRGDNAKALIKNDYSWSAIATQLIDHYHLITSKK